MSCGTVAGRSLNGPWVAQYRLPERQPQAVWPSALTDRNSGDLWAGAMDDNYANRVAEPLETLLVGTRATRLRSSADA